MIRLGLTGSIGMGKSTTARMFHDAGIPVWDADAAVHRLYAPGGGAVDAVGEICPDAVTSGGVDRAVLKKWINSDPNRLDRLESVVHPLVAQDRSTFLAEHKNAPLVVLDIPLLFETGNRDDFDAILVVTIDTATQRDRVLARPNMSEALMQQILDRQMPDAEKRALADHIIETRSLEQTRQDVEDLIANLTIPG
ncbi:MAG: dephospho-CoA kinase [Pseudomonadota bacterium]